jgi:hypothetical protein
MTAYQPRPGSTGDLTLQHIRANYGRISEEGLAIAIDKPADDLRGLLAWPIKQGALRRFKAPSGHLDEEDCWYYAEGDGVVLAQPEPPSQILVPPGMPHANGQDAGPISTREAAAARHPNGEGGGHAERRSPSLEASPPVGKPEALRGKNAAWWMTGELAVEAEDGTVILFNGSLAAKLVGFLASHGRGGAC